MDCIHISQTITTRNIASLERCDAPAPALSVHGCQPVWLGDAWNTCDGSPTKQKRGHRTCTLLQTLGLTNGAHAHKLSRRTSVRDPDVRRQLSAGGHQEAAAWGGGQRAARVLTVPIRNHVMTRSVPRRLAKK